MDWQSKLFSRRNFVKMLSVVVVGGTGLYAFVPSVRTLTGQLFSSTKAIAGHYLPIGDMDALYVRQLITNDSTTARTIMWQSEQSEVQAVVEYRLQGTEKIDLITANEEKFTDYKVTTYIHSATINNLKPEKSYEYRVGYDNKRGDWKPLNTAGQGKFKALIFPDSQSNDYSDWKKIAQTARRANPDADFFVNMGDLVDNGEDPVQWKAWFNSLEGVIDEIPGALVLGNHETYNMDWKVRMPDAYLKLFDLPSNGNTDFKNQYYSFDYGDVHFVVLNTQVDEMSDFQPEVLDAQLAWLEQDMANTQKMWKVVLMHKDVLTYEIKNRTNRTAGVSEIGKIFMPLFDKYNVDVVLTAHLHTYRRRGHIYNFHPAKQGPLYIVTGVAGNVRYANFWIDHPWDEFVAPQPETNNYLTLEATSQFLRIETFLPSGEKIDNVELNK